jgi:hypothetical protein
VSSGCRYEGKVQEETDSTAFSFSPMIFAYFVPDSGSAPVAVMTPHTRAPPALAAWQKACGYLSGVNSWQREVMPKLLDPVRDSAILDASLPDLIQVVKTQGLEGLVAKRCDSRYEPGQRSGALAKMRVNQAQELVIGGYKVGGRTFDAVVFGYYDGQRLIYVARTRNGFSPSSREALFRKFKGLEISQCPFANLPEAHSGRWDQRRWPASLTVSPPRR